MEESSVVVVGVVAVDPWVMDVREEMGLELARVEPGVEASGVCRVNPGVVVPGVMRGGG